MLEAQAYRTECEPDYEPWIVDAADYRFFPIGECSGCDEPTEVGYNCTECRALVCSGCVCGPLALIEKGITTRNLQDMALCPECPGACCAWSPTECYCDYWCTAVKAGDTCPNEGCGGLIPEAPRSNVRD